MSLSQDGNLDVGDEAPEPETEEESLPDDGVEEEPTPDDYMNAVTSDEDEEEETVQFPVDAG